MPCVAGCCGPMLRTMSPVSSSTFTCASARWRNIVGSTSTSGSSPGRRKVGAWSSSTPPPAGRRRLRRRGLARHRLDVDETGPRLHLAREQRVVLAQRVAFELGREIEVTQARDGRRTRCRTSPTPRARASRRRDTPTPTTPRAGRRRRRRSSGDAPSCGRRVDSTMREHLEAARADPPTPYVISFGCTGADVSPEPSSAIDRRGHPVDRRRRTRGSRSRAAPCRPARRARHASGRTRTTTSPNVAAVLDDRVAELRLEAREERRARERARRERRRGSVRLGASVVRRRSSGRRQPTTIGSRCVAVPPLGRVSRSGCAAATARCPG